MTLTLYTYWRSSAAWRVRIALNLKGLEYASVPIHLANGEQRRHDYLEINPQGLVPMLVLEDATKLTQSLAIIAYLDEHYPLPPLLPQSLTLRAQARAFAQIIACDTHPINNLRVLRYLEDRFGADDAAKKLWYQHWMHESLGVLEQQARMHGNGLYAVGDRASIADLCLIPHLYGARRWECDVSAYPTLLSVEAHCAALPAFTDAAPERQADAPE